MNHKKTVIGTLQLIQFGMNPIDTHRYDQDFIIICIIPFLIIILNACLFFS